MAEQLMRWTGAAWVPVISITRFATEGGYSPSVWNEDGDYSAFYVNFGSQLSPFSVGMASESLIVFDSAALQITKVQNIGGGIYKFSCNIAGKYQGVTVTNKETSLLTFANGNKVPPFSVHFFVAGIVSYERLHYLYEMVQLGLPILDNASEAFDTTGWDMMPPAGVSETCAIGISAISDAVEIVTIILT